MKIEEILDEDLVIADLAARTKAEVLVELARVVARHHPQLDEARPVGLLETLGENLALQLVAGEEGLARSITAPRVQQPGLALAGYLPQLHPDRMQVLGNSEIGYLATLEPAIARERVRSVVGSGVGCF